jgi:hypothetical protein
LDWLNLDWESVDPRPAMSLSSHGYAEETMEY